MDLKSAEIALREKLATEIRRCPQCNLEVTNPFIERCPRCFASIPRLSLDCTGCFYRTICPVKPDRP